MRAGAAERQKRPAAHEHRACSYTVSDSDCSSRVPAEPSITAAKTSALPGSQLPTCFSLDQAVYFYRADTVMVLDLTAFWKVAGRAPRTMPLRQSFDRRR